MDRMLYVAMSGAKQTMDAMTSNNNNLANVNTAAFRQDLAAFRSMPVYGDQAPTRVYAMTERPGTDFTPGALISTARDLDVAINGDGFIAVQSPLGDEAYSRRGDFHISNNGLLMNGAGHLVLGDGGPITLPPASKVEIANDGTVSMVPLGAESQNLVVVGRIKLVNPDTSALAKGEDGLFRLTTGEEADPDAAITITSGMIESSNVNAANAMVQMINLARQYESQVKMMSLAEKNDEAASALLQI